MIANFLKSLSLLDALNRRALWLVGFLILVGSGLEVLGVGLVFPLIKMVADPASFFAYPVVVRALDVLGQPDQQTVQIAILMGFALLFTAKNAFLFGSHYWQTQFFRRNEVEISVRLLRGYMHSPYTMHLNRNSAELVRNLISASPALLSGMLANSVRAVSELFVTISIVALLFAVDPFPATVSIVIVGGFMAMLYMVLRRRHEYWGREKLESDRKRMQSLYQTLAGVKEIKVLTRENFFIRQFHALQAFLAHVLVRSFTFAEVPRFALESLMIILITSVIVIRILSDSVSGDTMAVLGLFGAAGFRLMPSANRILNALNNIRQTLPAVNWIYSDFKEFSRLPPEPDSQDRLEFRSLVLERLSFRYERMERNVLDGIDMELPRGVSVALVGPSGAGKSTLADIILGLLSPNSGRMLINGAPIETHGRAWQRCLGYVPQSIAIFDDTIRRNVALGIPDDEIDEDAVRRCLKQAHVDDFIAGLPEALDTVVGERGVRLSGGQRQRLGIARALYHDPQVLVLDEATSALDSETERAISLAVDDLRGVKTLIIIAHRLSTIRHCDRVFFLQNGSLADSGTFDELAARNADFARMVELARLDKPVEQDSIPSA